jgi:hypothetical protein
MITPSAGLSGARGNPITVRALNEGQVLIDGQFVRTPVRLDGNNWFLIEGINARNSSGNVLLSIPLTTTSFGAQSSGMPQYIQRLTQLFWMIAATTSSRT